MHNQEHALHNGKATKERIHEQQRAKYALDCIDSINERKINVKNKYLTLVQRLPSMILANGVGQTVAFLRSLFKESETLAEEEIAAKELHDHLADWLIYRKFYRGSKRNLLHMLINSERDIYLQAEEELLALLTWLTRLADAFIEVPKRGEQKWLS